MTNKNRILGILILTAILLGLFFLVFRPEKINENGQIKTGTGTSPIGAFDSEGNPIDIQPIPITESLPPAPDMSGVIVFPKTYPQENRASIETKMRALQEAVKKEPANLSNWIEIGSYWKLLENYKNAEVAWNYASEIDKTSPVSLGNVAFMYGYIIHDNKKAEEYYLKAIERGEGYPYIYFQCAEFYRDVLKNAAKAKNVVDRGIIANPNDEQLKAFRASLNTL